MANASNKQFQVKPFSRGVKLTRQHVYDPATQVADGWNAAKIDPQRRAPIVFNAAVPLIDAAHAEYAASNGAPIPVGWIPMLLPPQQEAWDTNRQTNPNYITLLEEVSVSWDQQANVYACASSWCKIATDPVVAATVASQMPQVDASRLDMRIALIERTPSSTNGDTSTFAEVFSQELPGLTFFYAAGLRNNPSVFSGLQVQIKPYCVYYWAIYAPNLFPQDYTTEYCLALPSFTLCATMTAPLIRHRSSAQNFPVDQQQVLPAPFAFVPPAANAPITGTDVQQVMDRLEGPLETKLDFGVAPPSGTGASIPTAALASQRQVVSNDTALSIIAIPMWSPYVLNGVRAEACTEDVLPGYSALSPTDPAVDCCVVRVPDGMIIDNVFAFLGAYSPPAPNTATLTQQWAGEDINPNYFNKIGVGITTGLNTDRFAQQQVAYGSYNTANYSTWTVDNFKPMLPAGGSLVQRSVGRIVQVPLVSDAVRTGYGYTDNGEPFYVGAGNNISQNRSQCGQMPAQFGGGALVDPATAGQEQLLEIRWIKQNAVDGLDNPSQPLALRCGSLGDWLIITGTVPLGA